MGHQQTSRHVRVMSIIPLKADIRQHEWHVRLVPGTDITKAERRSFICRVGNHHSLAQKRNQAIRLIRAQRCCGSSHADLRGAPT